MLTEHDLMMLKANMIHSVELADLSYKGGLFIMTGPSGVHTLHGDTTDLDRLNAHWAGFRADTRNHFAAPMVLA